jgi:Flp pilus assembly pilin Flp
MIKFFKNFGKDDSGAVTVDWVVLTAAIVALTVAVFGTIQSNTSTLATTAGTAIGGGVPGVTP